MARPGQLNERITFQGQTRTPDGAGGTTLAYADIADTPTVWADVFAIRSTETDTEGRLNAAGLYKFTVRHRSDIDETNQIVWRSETYNIRNVRRTAGRDMYLIIEAERGI